MSDATRPDPSQHTGQELSIEALRQIVEEYVTEYDQQLDELRQDVIALGSAPSAEVRTRRLVVVDETGFERVVVAAERPNSGSVTLYSRTRPVHDSTTGVSLEAFEEDGQPSFGLSFVEYGNTVGVVNMRLGEDLVVDSEPTT